MKFSIFCVFILVLCSKVSSAVKVSVYYETLCPDSVAFINNQLHPNYKAFGDKLIQLELIPYGFAKENDINGTKTFICQHGPQECYGNKIHGCVINFETIATSDDFVYCSESSSPPTTTENLKHCADLVHVAWSGIEKCISSGQADDIMTRNGKKTDELHPHFIPAVVFNDIFNEDDSKQAIDDLKTVVCKYLDNKPDQCNSSKSIEVLLI